MKTVLIIDDESEFCEMLRILLTKRKYNVHVANNLEAGFIKLREVSPDALILDNNLPDGFGFIHAEDFLNRFPDLKIILISAQPLSNYFAGKVGRQFQFLQKPLSLEQIINYL